MGKDRQRPNTVTLSMPRELVLEARAKAIREGSNLSAVVRKLLREWMEEDPPKEDNDT
jgi:hypothetical protein